MTQSIDHAALEQTVPGSSLGYSLLFRLIMELVSVVNGSEKNKTAITLACANVINQSDEAKNQTGSFGGEAGLKKEKSQNQWHSLIFSAEPDSNSKTKIQSLKSNPSKSWKMSICTLVKDIQLVVLWNELERQAKSKLARA